MKGKILNVILEKINKLNKEKIKELFSNSELRRYLYIVLGRK